MTRGPASRAFELTARFALAACALGLLLGCSRTLDSLGRDPDAVGTPDASTPGALRPLTGPSAYPNAFRDLLGKSDAEISAKIAAAFAQLFHGDPASQSFYVTVGADQAKVIDTIHDDVRTEGLGVGMLIAVELDEKDEFDRLWSYAKSDQLEASGPARGYFDSVCDDATPCLDPYGMEQFVTALLFANDRWNGDGAASYGSDALALLDALQNKERENGGVSSGITNAFDGATQLVREQPALAEAGYTRSALETPAMYELWAQASGNAFWHGAATAARAHLVLASNATTGLWPMRSYFDGTPVPGFDHYTAQAYRAQLNLAEDAAWGGNTALEGALADRVLGFFTAQGLDRYGKEYTLEGAVLEATREQGLIAVNGALAIAASRANRTDFVNAVWAMPVPSGDPRYYDGILYLTSLLLLSGQYRVY